MNKEYIQQLFRNYIENFSYFENPKGGYEAYKWPAVKHVQDHWDLDTQNLSEMIKTSFAKTHNLLNNATVSPSTGLSLLAKEEPETIRRALSELLADFDDLDAKQEQVLSFRDEVNELLEKYYPGKWKYEHEVRNVITYLALIRPDDNYLYIPSRASYFARAMDYQADIGSGKHFRLMYYYQMCDELVEMILDSPELQEKVKSRNAYWPDQSWHLLASDLVYCFSTYPMMRKGIPEPPPYIRKSNWALRKDIQEAKAKALQEEIEEIQVQIEELNEEVSTLSDLWLVGRTVSTKAYGEVVIEDQDGSYISFTAQGKKREFSLPDCVINGFVDPHDEDIVSRCRQESDILQKLKPLYNARDAKRILLSSLKQ